MKLGSPRSLDLPYDTWRPGQRLAIRTALHSKTTHTVIQSPTGSGKSVIAAALVRLHEGRTPILTGTKGLEDQYAETFPFLYDVRGMGNYECLAASGEHKQYFTLRHFVDQARRRGVATAMCDDGPCRSGVPCTLKEAGCLYFDRYRGALASGAPLTNYAYWIAMRRFAKGLGAADRIVFDEAHRLPEELMSNCRVEIRSGLIEGNAPTTHKGWRDWAAAKLDALRPRGASGEDLRVRRQKLFASLEQLTGIDDTWAWDLLDDRVVFEPVIPRLLLPLLYDAATAPQLVYLSATITPATLALLDIPAAAITFQVMKARFPVDRRPVYLVESARVDHKMSAVDRDHWLSRIDKIISKRLDRRGILHTVSYARAQDILNASRYRGIMIAPRRASELAAAVAAYRTATPPVILLSPSIVTGWNFPYRECEYQILAKVPFPDTRSHIMQARIQATEGYRDHLTATMIEQAIGRGMRAADDRCETFIVDDHSRWFLGKARSLGLISQSCDEAIQYVAQPPAPPPPLH